MKRIVSLILIGLLVASGVDAMAQSKGKKTSRKGKKTTSMYVEGRQKVRQSDYATFDKFTNFSSKDNNVYYSPFNYIDIPGLTADVNPAWPEEIKPVMNYLEKVSRATMTLCAIYALNTSSASSSTSRPARRPRPRWTPSKTGRRRRA